VVVQVEKHTDIHDRWRTFSSLFAGEQVMNLIKHRLPGVLAVSAALLAYPLPSHAQDNTQTTVAEHTDTRRDGQHDFNFENGTWKTHLTRLLRPLSGSTTWVEYDGTTTVREVWNGRANLLELEADGNTGHIEALSLRLYNPVSHQWSLNFANSAGGALGTPTIGEFKNGRGEFIDQETLGLRAILVRFVITHSSPTTCHFEQSFSDDGGKTWELNWIADDSLISDVRDKGRYRPKNE
jgi:hypothetical protein